MNKKITRKEIFGSIKGIDKDRKIITAYASTNEWDRYGERFEPDAFKGDGLLNYLRNPVVLWAHDYGSKPIAKTIDYSFDSKGLILAMQFADHQEAQDIFDLYVGGFLSAFSVGFRAIEIGYEEKMKGSGDMGTVFKKAELLENSAVPVPANPGALVIKGLMPQACRVLGGDAPPEPRFADPLTPDDTGKLSLKDALSYLDSAHGRAQDHHDAAAAKDNDQDDKGGKKPKAEPPPPNGAICMKDMKGVMSHIKLARAAVHNIIGKEAEIELIRSARDGKAPDFGMTLEYLLTLGKMLKFRGKVEDDGLRSLLIQTNNLCRELVYGPAAPQIEAEKMSDEEMIALVKEYETLSEIVIARGAGVDDETRRDFESVGKIIDGLVRKTISGN